MANTEIKYGHDPKLRAMAKKLIDESKTEQRDLKQWISKHVD